jgi:hypothetical protein
MMRSIVNAVFGLAAILILYGSIMAVAMACCTEWRLALTWLGVQVLGWLIGVAAFATAQLVSGNRSGLRGWWRWQQTDVGGYYFTAPSNEVEKVDMVDLHGRPYRSGVELLTVIKGVAARVRVPVR